MEEMMIENQEFKAILEAKDAEVASLTKKLKICQDESDAKTVQLAKTRALAKMIHDRCKALAQYKKQLDEVKSSQTEKKDSVEVGALKEAFDSKKENKILQDNNAKLTEETRQLKQQLEELKKLGTRIVTLAKFVDKKE